MSGPGALPEPIFPWISPQIKDLFTRYQVEQVQAEAYAAGQADAKKRGLHDTTLASAAVEHVSREPTSPAAKETHMSETPALKARLEQWERGWRIHCGECAWSSRDLPFPDPDAAYHALTLHRVVRHERTA